jgi:hypothetical protein
MNRTRIPGEAFIACAAVLLAVLSGCAPPERVANDPLCLAVLEALPKSYGGGRSCEAGTDNLSLLPRR